MSVQALQNRVEEYLRLPYTIRVQYDDSEENPGWVAWVEELPGCITYADTKEEIMEMIQDVMRLWIETALTRGKPIPKPRKEKRDFSGRFVVRVPKSLHRKLVERAQHEGVSLNQWITSALAEAVGASAQQSISRPTENIPHWPGLALIAQQALREAGRSEEAAEQDERLVAAWFQEIAERIHRWLDVYDIEAVRNEIRRMVQTLEPYAHDSPFVRAWLHMLSVMERLLSDVGRPSVAIAVRQMVRQAPTSSVYSPPYPEQDLVEELFGGYLKA